MRYLPVLIVLSLAPAASIAHADPLSDAVGRYRVASSSHIHFSVAQLGGDPIEGEFAKFNGVFEIESDVAQSKVEFSLEPASVKAVDPRVEEFIKSEAVFNAAQFPTVSFRSTRIARTGKNSASVEGQLTAKGLTRSTKFDVEFLQQKGSSVRFHVTGKLSRAKFNMDVGVPIYSNMVVLDMDLMGVRKN
jgi:polyisoprenoid-binding protein YceI